MTGGAILHNVVKKTKPETRRVKIQGMWTWMEELFYEEGPVRAEASIMTYALKKKLYSTWICTQEKASQCAYDVVSDVE